MFKRYASTVVFFRCSVVGALRTRVARDETTAWWLLLRRRGGTARKGLWLDDL